MTDYPVDLVNETYEGGATTTGAGWNGDENTTTTLTLPEATDGSYIFDLEGDHTDETGIINFRVEAQVESGTGDLFWDFAFDKGATFVAFQGTMPVAGPGNYVYVADTPYFVGTAGGHTYDGIYDVLERIANVTGYHHGYGELETLIGSGTIVLSEFRVIFYSPSGRSRPVRLGPRDDGRGQSSAPRTVPPTKARRVTGGYQ